MTTTTVRKQLGATRPARPAGVVRTLAVLTRRNATKTARVPILLVFTMGFPIMMLLLFSQVFRTVENSPDYPTGVAYIDYLLPAILATGLVMNANNSGVGIAIDLQSGVVDRLRSMPILSWTLLAARSLTETVISIAQMVVVIVMATVLLDFEFQGSAAEAIGAVALLIPFSWSFTWLFMFIGARLRDPEAAQVSGMMLLMPLMFVSAAFVPVESFPAWLETVANLNPLSINVEAARGLVLGNPDTSDVLSALIASAVVAAIGIGAAATSQATAST